MSAAISLIFVFVCIGRLTGVGLSDLIFATNVIESQSRSESIAAGTGVIAYTGYNIQRQTSAVLNNARVRAQARSASFSS